MTTSDYSLTSAEALQFDRDGYLGPLTLYEPDEAKAMYAKVRVQLFDRRRAPYDAPAQSAIANYDRHLDLELLSEHICRREIVDRLIGIIGKDVLCWRSEFIPKYPGSEGTDWHQADTFGHASGRPQLVWPEGEPFGGTINVWTAFTDITEANGCMMFIPGSHREMHFDESKGMEFDPQKNNNIVKDGLRRGFNGYDYRVLQKNPDWKVPESRAAAMVMQAGQFVIFRSMLIHSSKPNVTKDTTRIGYVARYIPGRVKVYPNTDYVKEFGGEYSLKRYGVVEVSGRNLQPENRVATVTLAGTRFPTARQPVGGASVNL